MSELRIGTAIYVDEIKLIPIERIEIHSFGGIGAYAHKHAFAIIIRTDRQWRAIDIQGREISLDELLAKLPRLHGML